MDKTAFIVEILGARGSVPVSGEKFREFGGATSCIRVRAGNQEIYLDAGSGIINAEPEPDTELAVLLTHPHVDHLLGLSFFEGMAQKNRQITIYMKKRNALGLAQALRCLYSPPLWPVGILDYPANVRMYDSFPMVLELGGIGVRSMEGNHPGGSTIFRLDFEGRSLVYATDYEPTEKKDAELADFCKDATLLIYDGQYTQEEFPSKKGFGHSTPQQGVELANRANVQQLIITHHEPRHDDAALRQMEAEIAALRPRTSFARCGERIAL